jgi:hypothetical protein
MALKQDQRAMLQLLLERGQSYEDIASLLDLDTGAVRQRARAALTELCGTDPDTDVALTDYLLGQADPIGRADVVRHLKQAPEARAVAEELVAKLQVLAPGAELPELPGEARRRPAQAKSEAATAPAEGAATPRRRFGSTLSARQQQGLVALSAAALLVIAIVLVVTGAFGGGGGGSEGASTQTTATNEGVIRIPLAASGGGNASGQIVFARVSDQPVMQINASGLAQPRQGEVYVLWLYNNNRQAFPVGIVPERKGVAKAQQVLPAELTRVLPAFRFFDISLSQAAAVNARLRKATTSNPIPGYSGHSVLRGQIPRGTAQTGTTTTPGP